MDGENNKTEELLLNFDQNNQNDGLTITYKGKSLNFSESMLNDMNSDGKNLTIHEIRNICDQL